MANFEIGIYVRYMNKVWLVDSFYEYMMLLRNVDDDHLAVVLPHEYNHVEVY